MASGEGSNLSKFEKRHKLTNQLPDFYDYKDVTYWKVISILSIVFSIYHIGYAYYQPYPRSHHTILSLGLGYIIAIFIYFAMMNGEGTKKRFYKLLLTAMLLVIFVSTVYLFLNYDVIRGRLLRYTRIDFVIAGAMVTVTIELTRREFGTFLGAFTVLAILYALLGPKLPFFFNHSGEDIRRILESLVLTFHGTAIYGFISGIGATWVALFLIYVGLVQGYGGLDFIMNLAQNFGRRLSRGIPQVAVLSSGAVGSIIGSGIANTATTGPFSIPIMRKAGLDKNTASGIESTASIGGQVMPPVMGAAAFVLASILNMRYIDVAIKATIPALLFYAGVAFAVFLVGGRQISDDRAKIERVEINYIENVPIIISFLLLIYFLVVAEFSPLSAGLYTAVILIFLQLVWTILFSDDRILSLKEWFKSTLRGLQIGGAIMGPLMIVLAAISIISGMIQVGSLTQEISFFMLDISDNLFLILFLAMVLSLLFGMGLPVIAAYILVAILITPPLAEYGIEPFRAHLFALYFAVISGITPPVAPACAVACGISDSDFLTTCRESLKVGTPAFIIPYLFVFYPDLLNWNIRTPIVFVVSLLGMAVILIGINGYPGKSIRNVNKFGLIILGTGVLISIKYIIGII